MKIGILQCGEVREEFTERYGDYPAMLMNLLSCEGGELTFETYRVFDGELPPTIEACDAYLTTGSRFGVNDAEPWIEPFLEFLRQLDRAKKKTIGICFGHQALAKALGGRVETSAWGVGVAHYEVHQRRPWMLPPKEALDLVVSHQDQVIAVPPRAVVLAGSDFCPNYMFAIDEHIMGIQGHPEFSTAYADDLLETRRDRIDAATIDAAKRSFGNPVDATLFARWMINFLRTPS
jgi:GMP synthase (glutamine-hydrolysing)